MYAKKFNFFHDQPLFGLDIGHSTLKVMQLVSDRGKMPRVAGYGVSGVFAADTLKDGVIVDQKTLIQTLYELFKKKLVGEINTRRVACTVPTSHTFSRPMKLPPMEEEELADAIHLEVEQYIPVSRDNLYIDYEISRRDENGIELLMVATPKKIIDSYISFLESVSLEPVALEPTMNATTRLFGIADASHKQPSVLVDFGSAAIDIAVFDKTMFVNNTLAGGSDTLTNQIAKKLSVVPAEAFALKNRYGIGISDKQAGIMEVARPMLDNLVREVQKIMRYYDQRTAHQNKIVQIIIMGGGSIMPGLSEYLAGQLNMPARSLDPWQAIDFGLLPPPSKVERSMYLTVAGVALLKPQEISHD